MPTVDQVIVELQARLEGYNVRLRDAERQFDRSMRNIERRSTLAGNNISAGFLRLARGVAGPLAAIGSAAFAAQAVNSFTRIENALRIAGLEGEEVGRTFERLTDIATKNGAPVEALAQLYGRLAIVQKELGVNSGEIERFLEGVAAALRVSGRSAEESRGALLQLSQAMGAGIVRAEEFNAILEGALPIAQAAARGLEEAGGSVAKLRTLIIDGKVSSQAFFRAFEAGQGDLEALAETAELTLGQAFTNLQTEMIGAIGKLDQASGASRALIGVMEVLAGTIGDVSAALVNLPSIEVGSTNIGELFKGGVGILLEEADKLTGQNSKLNMAAVETEMNLGAIERAAEKLKATLSNNQVTGEEVLSPEAAKKAEEVAARMQQAFAAAGISKEPVSLKDFKAPTPSGSKKTPEQKFATDIMAIEERTKALQREAEAVGLVTFEAEKLLAVQGLETEARRAGLAITPAVKEQIDQLATSYANAAVELEKSHLAQERMVETLDFFRASSREFLGGFIQDLRAGKDGIEALSNAVSRLQDRFIDLASDSLINGLFGKMGGGPNAAGGGGLFGSLLGGLFGGLSPGARSLSGPGLFARGGVANRPSIFGDSGAEAAVPLPDGRRIPVDLRDSRVGSGSSSQIIFDPEIVPPSGYTTRIDETDDGRGGKKPRITFQEMVGAGLGSSEARRQQGLPARTVRRG